MTRKTRIWLGWLVIVISAIFVVIFSFPADRFSVGEIGRLLVYFVAAGIVASIFVIPLWRPIDYFICKKKAQ